MPPSSSRPGSRIRRIHLVLVLLVVLLATGIYGCTRLGTFLNTEEPLRKADVIVVLAGTLVERPLEANDLYREGWAPRILVTRALADRAYLIAVQRGVTLPAESDLTRQALLQLGIPESALIMPTKFHDNTADEARTFREYAQRLGWRRAILVSSKYHLRRVGLAYRRELQGTGIEIILRGSRYDDSDPSHWWRYRSDVRWLLTEIPKLVAYRLGLGAD